MYMYEIRCGTVHMNVNKVSIQIFFEKEDVVQRDREERRYID
jgi:hypothetical protein